MIFLLFVFSIAAHAQPPASMEAISTRISGDREGETHALRWSADRKRCEASHSLPNQKQNWRSVPTQACATAEKEFQAARLELEKLAIPKGEMTPLLYGVTSGLLTMGDLRVPIDYQTAELCDVTLKHCRRPQLTVASSLAWNLRKEIVKRLASGDRGR